MPEKQIIAGGLTQADIDKLKAKHGAITLITVFEADDTEAHFWFRKPDMNTMRAVVAVAEKDPVQATTVYFKNCLILGDHEAVNDVETFMSIQPYLQELVKEKQVQVKNF